MTKKSELPYLYAQSMKIKGFGHGFYEPPSSKVLRPGVCGYINNNGQWQHIVEPAKQDIPNTEGYTGIDPLIWAEPFEAVWKETTSEGVSAQNISVDVAADATAVAAPVEASMVFSLDSSIEYGAALLCNTSVWRKGYAHDDPLRDWAKANAAAILKNHRSVKRHGFYVVQTTWSAGDMWTNAWTASQKAVSIGFKARIAEVGELGPSLEYSNAHSGGGWIHPIPSMKNGKLEGRVVFFQGLRFKYKYARFGSSHATEVRGSEESIIITDPVDEAKKYEVVWASLSDDEADDDESGDDEMDSETDEDVGEPMEE